MQRQISLCEMAQSAEISQTHLSNIERGVKPASLDTVVHLVEMLDVSIDYIVFGTAAVSPAAGLILRSDEELNERYGMED